MAHVEGGFLSSPVEISHTAVYNISVTSRLPFMLSRQGFGVCFSVCMVETKYDGDKAGGYVVVSGGLKYLR